MINTRIVGDLSLRFSLTHCLTDQGLSRRTHIQATQVRPQTSKQRVSDAGEAAVADCWTSTKESKANHHVQNCPSSRCSANFISYPSGSTHQMQPPVHVQVHLGVHNRIQGIFLPPNNSPVERTWQRNRRSDFHQLLQKSSALVRRRRSSTWYPT